VFDYKIEFHAQYNTSACYAKIQAEFLGASPIFLPRLTFKLKIRYFLPLRFPSPVFKWGPIAPRQPVSWREAGALATP
ncbi:MAG: hypothetical protein CRN43_20755, partial [Candidatus Nephrothrix sp. EaCA]